MPRVPEEQIVRELHELNRTMSDIRNMFKRFIGVQHIPKKVILTKDEDLITEPIDNSPEKQSL